jgi:putative ABC transport system permease protein
MGVEARFTLQEITDIHLHSHYVDEYEANQDIQTVYIVLASGLLILLIGCFNFINLSTAKSMKRAREVGMRKTLGGMRKQIIQQFMGESFLFTFLSLLVALLLLEIFIPDLNLISGADIKLSLNNTFTWTAIVFIGAITALLAGLYPAFYLSAFQPITVLKGTMRGAHSKNTFRNILVLLQFIISIALISGTFIIYDQLQFIQNKNLGYNKEQVLSISYHKDDFAEKHKEIITALERLPEIKTISAALSSPVGFKYSEGYLPEGANSPIMTTTMPVDEGFLETMEIKLKDGRFFEGGSKTDSAKIVMNENMVNELGWEEPLGKIIERNGVRYTVIGVVENFHFQSLHSPISRLIMIYDPGRFHTVLARLHRGQATEDVLQKIEKTWKTYEASYPFEYHFLDRIYDQQYKNDQQFGQMIIYLSLLAIFIACTGLFGLAAFSAEQRIREIGIRKVFGASETNIMKMMMSEFVKWVLLAALGAIPLSWYLMNNWLDSFAYHTEITLVPFLAAVLAALIIASVTVLTQSVKAARLNPAQTIKYE